MVQAATLAQTDEKPQRRPFRVGRWIVVILWGAAAVVLAGLALSYALPRNERLLTLPGPTYVIVADGVATAASGIEIEKDVIVVNRIDTNLWAPDDDIGIPYVWRYVGFRGPGGVWHFDVSLWCLIGLTTAMAAIGTWLVVFRQRGRFHRSSPDRAAPSA
jgi:hypothetical protein